LENHPDALVVTKIGIAIDESSKTLIGPDEKASAVLPAIDDCLKRLNRDNIDLLLLHQNGLAIEEANAFFDEMETAQEMGKIRSFGWSTDFAESAKAMSDRSGFVAVEHAMHVLMDAPNMQSVLDKSHLHALIRSPLAMGLLSGKYAISSELPPKDIRARNQGWAQYYIDGKPNPEYVNRFNAVRELLQTDGRTPVQGALGWLWAKSATNIPIPGARNVAQVEGLAAAIEFGALPNAVMDEIESLVGDFGLSEGYSER